MKAAKILKEKINQEVVTLGVLATFHIWPGAVEIVRKAGFDYFIVDLEHGAYPDDLVAQLCDIGRLTEFPVLIRPPSHEYATIRTVIDRGPCGLLIPCVESVHTMNQIQESVYMPPRGKRRPGGAGNRWVPNFQYETWRHEVEEHLIILPQIESRQGLKNAEAIAQHPLTTAIAIGPYDLSADLGVCYDPTQPVFINALQTIRNAGRAAGKNMWMIGDGAAARKEGYTFLCVCELTALLEQTLQNENKRVRSVKPE